MTVQNGTIYRGYGSRIGNFNAAVPGFAQAETTVKSIIDDVCARAGLAPGQWDASQCQDTVRGYVVNNGPSARDALSPLLQMFFIDVADTGGVLKFVRRGGASVTTIPFAEVGAVAQSGAVAADPLKRVRAQEIELPCQFALTYYGAYNELNANTQTAFRTQTQSNFKATSRAPIAMTDGEALQAAQALLWATWMGRETFEFSTRLAYLNLEPADIVTVIDEVNNAHVVRLMRCSHDGGGVLSWTAQAETPSVYPMAGADTGSCGRHPVRLRAATGRLCRAIDHCRARYPAAARAGCQRARALRRRVRLGSSWPGCSIEMSRDDSTFAEMVSVLIPCAMGSVETTLGTFAGGNQPDELNAITVDLYDPVSALSSVTYAQFLNNAQVACIGSEIVGFRNAVQNADGSYTVNGLLRGLLGTEWAIGSHVLGEQFVLLDPAALEGVGANLNDLGQPLYFLPVARRDGARLARYGQDCSDQRARATAVAGTVPGVSIRFRRVRLAHDQVAAPRAHQCAMAFEHRRAARRDDGGLYRHGLRRQRQHTLAILVHPDLYGIHAAELYMARLGLDGGHVGAGVRERVDECDRHDHGATA